MLPLLCLEVVETGLGVPGVFFVRDAPSDMGVFGELDVAGVTVCWQTRTMVTASRQRDRMGAIALIEAEII